MEAATGKILITKMCLGRTRWNAHHDIYHLISLVGGAETFVDRLETFFKPGIFHNDDFDNEPFGNTIFNLGNEPAFTTPYLFNFAGKQDLSVKYSRHTALSYYGEDKAACPVIATLGAMQTWMLWNMIGLYPMTGQTSFLIGSPWFEHLEIDAR